MRGWFSSHIGQHKSSLLEEGQNSIGGEGVLLPPIVKLSGGRDLEIVHQEDQEGKSMLFCSQEHVLHIASVC